MAPPLSPGPPQLLGPAPELPGPALSPRPQPGSEPASAAPSPAPESRTSSPSNGRSCGGHGLRWRLDGPQDRARDGPGSSPRSHAHWVSSRVGGVSKSIPQLRVIRGGEGGLGRKRASTSPVLASRPSPPGVRTGVRNRDRLQARSARMLGLKLGMAFYMGTGAILATPLPIQLLANDLGKAGVVALGAGGPCTHHGDQGEAPGLCLALAFGAIRGVGQQWKILSPPSPLTPPTLPFLPLLMSPLEAAGTWGPPLTGGAGLLA